MSLPAVASCTKKPPNSASVIAAPSTSPFTAMVVRSLPAAPRRCCASAIPYIAISIDAGGGPPPGFSSASCEPVSCAAQPRTRARSAGGTPSISPNTSLGSSAATSSTNSTSRFAPARAKIARAISRTRGSSAATSRGVNEPCKSLRKRRCSGGSMPSRVKRIMASCASESGSITTKPRSRREQLRVARDLRHVRVLRERPVAATVRCRLPVHGPLAAQPREVRVGRTRGVAVGRVDVDLVGARARETRARCSQEPRELLADGAELEQAVDHAQLGVRQELDQPLGRRERMARIAARSDHERGDLEPAQPRRVGQIARSRSAQHPREVGRALGAQAREHGFLPLLVEAGHRVRAKRRAHRVEIGVHTARRDQRRAPAVQVRLRLAGLPGGRRHRGAPSPRTRPARAAPRAASSPYPSRPRLRPAAPARARRTARAGHRRVRARRRRRPRVRRPNVRGRARRSAPSARRAARRTARPCRSRSLSRSSS